MIFLQGADGELVADVFGHSLHGGQGRLDGGDRADPVGVGRLADLLAVAARPAALALRRVDDEGDLAAGDQVDGVDPVPVGDLADDGVDARPRSWRGSRRCPVVAAMPRPSSRSRRATTIPAGLSPSASDRNTVPSVGSTVPAASSAL